MVTVHQVWIAAGKAIISFIMKIMDKDVISIHFHDTLPLVLDVSNTIFVSEMCSLVEHVSSLKRVKSP